MRTIRFIALLLAIAALLCLTAFAAETGSITVHFAIHDTPVAGAAFRAYRVADADDAGSFSPAAPFSDYPVALKNTAWKDLADTYAGYARRDQLAASAQGVTDEKGELTFSDLRAGLYLILGDRVSFGDGSYQPAALLVAIPERGDGGVSFDVDAEVKTEIKPPVGTPVSRKVLKIWNDEGAEASRPSEITVQLLRDGRVYDTVTLSAKNEWRHVWDDLDGSYEWEAVEKEIEGYTVQVGREGPTFTITNSVAGKDGGDEGGDTPGKPGTPDKPGTPGGSTPGRANLPQTGQLWWPVPLMALLGLIFLIIGLRQHRTKHEG